MCESNNREFAGLNFFVIFPQPLKPLLVLFASFLFVISFPDTVHAQSWYNSSWTYRKAITIDYTKVGTGPHTNFPVLISRADADLQTKALSTGNDILFTSSDGTTKLSHEIESYTSASGTLVAWVEIPSLSSSANTVIYMYYGNASATSQQDVTGTWDANFKGVYHLNNAFADATSNANNGTNTGTTNITGKISQGRGFVPGDGADNIAITGLMGSPATLTMSSWFYRNSTATEHSMIVSLGDYVNMMRGNVASSLEGNYYNGSTWLGTKTNINYDNGWHYAVYTITGGGSSQKIYVDGALVTSTTNAAAITYTGLGTNTRIGSHANGSTGFDYDGNLDEVRVANTTRSAGWILTEYNNQNSPSTFYSIGSETGEVKTWDGGAGTSNWGDANNWNPNGVPTSANDVNLTGANTININVAAVANNFTLNNAGLTLTIQSTRSLAISSNLTITNGTLNTAASFPVVTGTVSITGGTVGYTATTGSQTVSARTYNNLIFSGGGTRTMPGSTITVNADLTLTGTPSATAAASLDVNGNFTIGSGCTFSAGSYTHTLDGNFVNNGTFTASASTMKFTGATSTSVSGSSTTAFNNITVDKGTSNTNILDVQSVVTMTAGGLIITNGTFKLSSASTITPWTSEISVSPYNIPSTGGLWVNGGTVSTTSQISFAGLIRASAGTLNVGDAIDERLYLRPGSASIIVDGGAVNVASRLSYANTTDVLSFTMSSGVFTVGASGNTPVVAPFTIYAAASTFTMSGGTIVIIKSGGSNVGYYNGAGTSNVTGGTLQIGNASTPASNTMQVYSVPPIWNLTVNSTNSPVAQLSADLVVYNDLTISGGTLDANNFNLTIGGNWVNSGTFTPGTATVNFNGTTTMSGTTVTNTFNNLTIAASSTVTSSSGITGLVVNGVLTTGASATIDLATTTILSGTLGTISNSGTIKTAVPSTTSATPIPAGKTWGGLVDYNNGSANQTIIGGTYNDLTVRPGNAKTATASGNLVVNGILTVTTAFGAFDLSTYVLSGTLSSIVNNGDIKTSNTSATPIPSGKTWGGTIYYNATTGAQTVVGGTYNIIRFLNTSGTNTAAGDLTVNNQFITTAGGTLDMGSSYRIINMGSTITNNGTVKTSVLTTTSVTPFANGKTWGGTGTVEYAATTGAQTVMSGTFNNLKLSNTSGNNIINGNVTLNGVLTLSGGTVTTNAFVISVNAGASVSRTSGHVIGNLKKNVATGATTATFEIGDVTNYTPVTVAFASVTTAQYLTATVTTTDHPNLSGSGIRTDRSENRYWTLTNQGIVFTTAIVTMNWVSGDVDAGATPANFIVGQYSSGWTLPAVGTKTLTSAQATGITSFGDFQCGEVCTATTTSNAGADQTGATTCGLTTVTLAGNTPSVGTGTWSIFSGTGGTVTTPASSTSTFTGTAASSYTLRWTISNSGCSTSTDDVIITFNQNPTTSNAGADQTSAATCGLTTITLAANTPPVGAGAWSIISGTGGNVTTPVSATSTFTGTAGTTYTLRWTTSNSPCTSSTDDVVVAFNQSPATSNAGPDQTGAATCGLTTVTLAGNSPSVGTGAWSIVSGTGGTVTTPSSATSTFTGTAGSTYTLRWTTSNSPCTSSTDDVIVTFNRNPATSNAGVDQTGAATCGLTTVTLAGNSPSLGTGAWSIVSGTGGTVTTPSSATSTFTGTAGNTYTLRWTISNSPCTASTDDVIITFNISPTTSNAGPDQTGAATCGLTAVTLAGNSPSVGTGAWSIVSGTGGTVTTPSSATSTFTGTAGTTYTLRWTTTNGSCSSADDIIITFNRTPTTSNAGPDQTGSATCGLTTITLAGNTPSVGTGAWSIVSGTGGTVNTPSSATSTFTGTAGSTYTLRWTISSSPCTASTDDVIITFNQTPTTANAGADQTSSATCGLTTVTLAGNTPSVGTGAWSIVSGTGGTVTTPSNATSTFSGTAGTTYTLRWTISNSPCTASTDDVVITFNQTPTTANAGADQTGSATCGLTSVTLAGNTPSVGTGSWSIISGTGGTVTTPSNATSTFSGTAGTTYTLRWTISNSPCTASTDDVVITFNQTPTTANAGADQTGAATCGLTTITLAGNSLSVGTGAWSIVSGTGGTVTTPSSATSTFTGTAGTTYTLRWTISNSPCTASTDDVVITFNQTPTTANAGADQTGSATCGLTSVTLAGNIPSVGTGAWSIVSGTGGTVTTPSSATSTFTGTAGTTYTLRWTISNSPCTASTDDVVITFNQNSSAAISYTGTPYCSSAGTATVTRTGTAGGTYSSTSGLVINSSTGDITLALSTAGTYTVTYTMVNGVCTTTATTNITITTQPFANGYYAGNPYCSNGGVAFPKGSSSGASGTLSSTTGLTLDPSNGVVTLGSSTPGTYTVTYTVPASGGCSLYTTSSTITITAAPSATISYSGSPYCITSGTATVTRTGTAGGTYTSTTGLTINSSTGDITLASSTAGSYTVTYTVAAASGCSQYTTTTSVTISATSTWSGSVSSNWNTSGNWSCNSLPGASSNVVIPAGLSTYPVIAAATTGLTNNITIQSGASLTVNGTLQIAGLITNNGTFTATGGTIAMNGSSAQTIAAATFAGNTINGLTINNTAGVTLGGILNLTDALTVSAGSFATGGYLTLKSSATATARVARITSASGTPITGNVTVDRYVPGRRRYRIITSSVTTSASTTLSVGQEAFSIWGNWQNQGNNITGNVGTIITGGTSADGFDQQTANPSLFTYDDVNRVYTRYNTTNGKNTKYTPLKAGVPYYMFVYGDRLNTVSTANPNSTVIKASGTLLTGDQTYNTSSAIPLSNVTGRYTMLGNPFASPIDWGSVQKTNISGTYWGWDPNLSSTGGYVTVSTAGSVTLISPFSGSTGLNQYIQPGQGFFVKTTATSPSLIIREQDKVGSFNANAFRTGGNAANNVALMAINLQYANGATYVLADGVVAAFDPSFPNTVGDEDGGKMGNGTTTESIGIVEGADILSIDAKQLPQDKDTLFLDVKRLTKPQYTLEIFTQQMDGIPAIPYLEDSYLGTSLPLSLTDTNRIVVNVTAANPASSAVNRFRIVFRQMDILPVTFTSIQASVKNKYIQVDWNVAQENAIKKYEIERSADGINFTKVAEVNAKGNNSAESYHWLDTNPGSGINHYRVRAIQNDGKIYLTKIVAATIVLPAKATLVVFPNPIQNREIKFVLEAIEKGQYTLQLYSAEGQKNITRLFDHNGGVSHQVVQLDKNLPVGIYYLTIRNKKNVFYHTVFID